MNGDVALMDRSLSPLGFSTTRITGAEASASGIRARYRELIDYSGPDDAAVVYYSGHGGHVRDPAAVDTGRPEWLQFLVPSDAHEPAGEMPRVILAEELDLLGRELTARTRNATVVLDCCHAARMSRDGFAIPRADPTVGLDLDVAAAWRTELRRRAAWVASAQTSAATRTRIWCGWWAVRRTRAPSSCRARRSAAACTGRSRRRWRRRLPARPRPCALGGTCSTLFVGRCSERIPGSGPQVEGPADQQPLAEAPAAASRKYLTCAGGRVASRRLAEDLGAVRHRR